MWKMPSSRCRARAALAACLVPVLLAVVCLLVETTGARADSGPVAVARLLAGAATMAPNEAATPVVIRTGTRVPSGWFVTTHEATNLELALPDSAVVRLGPAPTVVRWQQGRLQTVTVTVHSGSTFHRLSRLPDNSSYRVISPTTVSGVRGTRFLVEVGQNGAARTLVNEGEVAIGEGSPERELGPGDEHVGWLGEEGESPETNWLRSQLVLDARSAGALTAAAGERMALTNEMTSQDYAEMAVLTEEVMRFVLNQPRTAEQIERAAEVFTRGLRLYQRMSTRSALMEARYSLSRTLQAKFQVDNDAAEREYATFSDRQASQGQGLETFISRLELLVKVLRTARTAATAAGAVTGGGIRLPSIPGGGWFGR